MNLKSYVSSSLVALLLAVALPESHAHATGKGDSAASPNGGRLITSIEPHAEFFVRADRKVQIAFVDAAGRILAPAGQTVTVTAGDRAAPTRLEFTQSGNLLVSNRALPDGNDFPAVVQIKSAGNPKAVVERFNVNLTPCPECSRPEYACACESGHGEHGAKH